MPIVVGGSKAWVTPVEGILERVVQHGGAHVEEELHRSPAPAHLLGLVHAPRDDLVHGAFRERGRDRFTLPVPGGIGHQCRLVALKIAGQVGGGLALFVNLNHLVRIPVNLSGGRGSETAACGRSW